MVVYISMFLATGLIYLFDSQYGKKNGKASKMAAFLLFAYFIFWIGMRDSFVDTAAYIRRFEMASMGDLSNLEFSIGSDFGFTIIEVIFKKLISSNYHCWLMFLAAVSGMCVAYTFQKYSENFYYTVFLFLSTTTFAWLMNGIRQFLAVAILFACTPLIERKKTLSYILMVLLCSTIHASCLMMIPVYFVVQMKPWKKGTWFVIAMVVFAVFFTSQFTDIMDTVLADTTYANVSEKYVMDDGVNPLRVVVFSVVPVLAFMGRKLLEKENDKVIDICINMSIVTAAIYAVGMVTSGIMIGRLPIYTLMYEFILLPHVINKCFTKESRNLLYLISFVAFLCYFYLMSRGFYYSSSFTGRI